MSIYEKGKTMLKSEIKSSGYEIIFVGSNCHYEYQLDNGIETIFANSIAENILKFENVLVHNEKERKNARQTSF